MKSEKSIMLMTENGNQLTEYGIMLTAFVITVLELSAAGFRLSALIS